MVMITIKTITNIPYLSRAIHLGKSFRYFRLYECHVEPAGHPPLRPLAVSSGCARQLFPAVLKDFVSEVRNLIGDRESAWWELTPEQLSNHVRRNTAVARWLERTLGWRPLLRACVGR